MIEFELVRKSLTPDLLTKKWAVQTKPMSGYCYVASEALYHLLGGKAAGWTPCVARIPEGTHWWIQHKDGQIVDPTFDQFDDPFDYSLGKGSGFLTKEPSRRAQVVINRVREYL